MTDNTQIAVCPLCGNKSQNHIRHKDGQKYIYQCGECGVFFTVFPHSEIVDIQSGHFDKVWQASRILTRNDLIKNAEVRLSALQNYITNGDLLEIGFGTGEFLLVASQAGFSVFGVDLFGNLPADFPLMHRVKISYLEKDAFPSAHFTAIVAFHTLEHLDAPANFLRLISRFIKPNGILFLIVPNVDCWQRKIAGKRWEGFKDAHLIHYSDKTLARITESAGFKILKCETREDGSFWAGYLLKPVYWIMRPLIKRINRRFESELENSPPSETQPASSAARAKRFIKRTFAFASNALAKTFYPLCKLQERYNAGQELWLIARKVNNV